MANDTGIESINKVLSYADRTYSKLPNRMKLQIEEIVRGLAQFGPRNLPRKGIGMEFLEPRDYHPDKDEIKDINPRMSARAGKKIVLEKEAEVRQHFYLWRKGSGTMNFSSEPKQLSTKKEAAEVMLLALAKHLAQNEESIGVLDKKGTYAGGRVPGKVAHHLLDVNIITGDVPDLHRKLPKNSTVVLFSDFYGDPKELVESLDRLTGQSLRGYMIMTLDPQELEFNKYKDRTKFNGLSGEASKKFGKAEALRESYQHRMNQYINWVEKLATDKGFELIIQRTDQPLSNALLQIYGLRPNIRENNIQRGPV